MGIKQGLSNCWDWLWNKERYAPPESTAVWQYASLPLSPGFLATMLLAGSILVYAETLSKKTPASLPAIETRGANSNLEKNLMNSSAEKTQKIRDD